MRKSHSWIVLALVLSMLLAVLAGCGNAPDTGYETSTASSEAAGTSEEAAQQEETSQTPVLSGTADTLAGTVWKMDAFMNAYETDDIAEVYYEVYGCRLDVILEFAENEMAYLHEYRDGEEGRVIEIPYEQDGSTLTLDNGNNVVNFFDGETIKVFSCDFGFEGSILVFHQTDEAAIAPATDGESQDGESQNEAEANEEQTDAPAAISRAELDKSSTCLAIMLDEDSFVPIYRTTASGSGYTTTYISGGAQLRHPAPDSHNANNLHLYNSFIVKDDYEIPEVERDKKLIYVSDVPTESVFNLYLWPSERTAYGLGLVEDGNYLVDCAKLAAVGPIAAEWPDFNIPENVQEYDAIPKNNLTLNGVPLEDCETAEGWFVFPEKSDVTIGYYEGTKYSELTASTDYIVYQLCDQEDVIKIEGQLTQNGYVEFDISNVPEGVYYVIESGFDGPVPTEATEAIQIS